MTPATIKLIAGREPLRDGEDPVIHQVGAREVTRIEQIEENFGTYGIRWFQVWKGDKLHCIMNALDVSEVYFND